MATFPLGTTLGAPVVPGGAASQYATHYENFGAGGWRTCYTLAERNAIPIDTAAGLHFDGFGSGRRRVGMPVVLADNVEDSSGWITYRLVMPAGWLAMNDAAKLAELANDANWYVWQIGGGSVASGAPQWLPGQQTEGALVYDAGFVYRVRRDIFNSQTAPGANTANYLLIGPCTGGGGPTLEPMAEYSYQAKTGLLTGWFPAGTLRVLSVALGQVKPVAGAKPRTTYKNANFKLSTYY